MSAELYLRCASFGEILPPPAFRGEISPPRTIGILSRRLFIAKRPLAAKPAAAIPPCFYLAAEQQILNLTRAALRQNFAEILLAALQNSDLLSKAPPARAKLAR